MTTQHKALELAGLLNKEVWPAHMTIHKWADEAAAELRAQHALIVQMREAMMMADKTLEFEGYFNEGPTRSVVIAAATAADKYLGEKE